MRSATHFRARAELPQCRLPVKPEQPHARYWQSCPECARRGQELAVLGRNAQAVQTVTQSEHAEAALPFTGTRCCREIIALADRALGHRLNEQEATKLS
jgi:hypothetical protein